MDTRTVKVPGPEHTITIEPAAAHVTVSIDGVEVASSANALVLDEAHHTPRYYIPHADIDQSLLRPSSTETYCPYKGDASYHTVVTPGKTVEDAGWEYREPYPAVAEIAGHVAFYADRVTVEVGREGDADSVPTT